MNVTRGRFPEDLDVPSEVFFWIGGGLKEQEAGQSVCDATKKKYKARLRDCKERMRHFSCGFR